MESSFFLKKNENQAHHSDFKRLFEPFQEVWRRISRGGMGETNEGFKLCGSEPKIPRGHLLEIRPNPRS